MLLDVSSQSDPPRLLAAFEVKSVRRSNAKLEPQFASHLERMSKGLTLEDRSGTIVRYESIAADHPLLVSVGPGGRRLSRRYKWGTTPNGERLPLPEWPEELPEAGSPRIVGGLTRIQLRVSQEELDEAGFGMTYWYMGMAGEKGLGTTPDRPRDTSMTPSEDGQNRVRHMLHLLGLRPLTDRLRSQTAKLFSVYCYGYALGIDSRGMLWPEDFDLPEGETIGVAPKARDWFGPRTFEFDMENGWKQWEVEHDASLGSWNCSITLKDLAPSREYEVGFHVGLEQPLAVSAMVSVSHSDGEWIELERQPPRTEDDPPSPFPADPVILRRDIGTAMVISNPKGRVRLSFRFFGAPDIRDGRVVRRLVAAFDPSTTTRRNE